MDDENIQPDLLVSKIQLHSSEKLCEMIVSQRYLNLDKKIAVLCMTELAKRRLNGEEFNYEEYIEKAYNELDPINISIYDIGPIISGSKK